MPHLGVLLTVLSALFFFNNIELLYSHFVPNKKTLFEQETSGIAEDVLLPFLLSGKEHAETASPRVTAISFASGHLKYLTDNRCDGREYMAALIHELSVLRRRVVVIDKYYSSDGCADERSNKKLLDAVSQSRSHLLFARQLEETKDGPRGWTYTFSNPFYFSPNAGWGIIPFNKDARKIPLQWWVKDDAGTERLQDTLAFAAAKAEDPSLGDGRILSKFLNERRSPFMEYPALAIDAASAEDVLCAGDSRSTSELLAKLNCKSARPVRLQDVVVIGDPDKSDRFQVGEDGDYYGYQLNAMYIEALLNRAYFRELPFSLWFAFLFAWCLATTVILEFFDSDCKRRMFVRCAFLITGAMFFLASGLSIAADYFPPILFLVGIVSNWVVLVLLELQRCATERFKKSRRPIKAAEAQHLR